MKKYFYILVLSMLSTALTKPMESANKGLLLNVKKEELQGTMNAARNANINYQDPTTGDTALIIAVTNYTDALKQHQNAFKEGSDVSLEGIEFAGQRLNNTKKILDFILSQNPNVSLKNKKGEFAYNIINQATEIASDQRPQLINKLNKMEQEQVELGLPQLEASLNQLANAIQG